jgi:hypothetical protein
MARKIEPKKNSPRPILLSVVTLYFLLEAFIAISILITDISAYFPSLYNALLQSRFIFQELPEFQNYDPFSLAIIQTPIYIDTFVYLKDIFLLIVFCFAGYTLFYMKRSGYYLGLFISLFGIIFGTTYGLRHFPIFYISTIIKGIAISSNDISWPLVLISAIITLLFPFYLIINRRLFIY